MAANVEDQDTVVGEYSGDSDSGKKTIMLKSVSVLWSYSFIVLVSLLIKWLSLYCTITEQSVEEDDVETTHNAMDDSTEGDRNESDEGDLPPDSSDEEISELTVCNEFYIRA